MIKIRSTTEKKDVHLLESVVVSHVSLVDRPANRSSFLLVKSDKDTADKEGKPSLDKLLDDEKKAWEDMGADSKVDKVASPSKPKGRWASNKSGKRFFVPEEKLRDKTGANDLARGRKLPKQKANLR